MVNRSGLLLPYAGEIVRSVPRPGLFDHKGPAVGQDLIRKWSAADKRFANIHPEAVRRGPQTVDFLTGENNCTNRNAVNNPLGLIRPIRLASEQSFRLSCGGREERRDYGSKDMSDDRDDGPKILHYQIREEVAYTVVVRAFDRFAADVLKSLNTEDAAERMQKIETSFPKPKIGEVLGQHFNAMCNNDTLNSWTLYSALSIFDDPAEGITALARFRALELLGMFDMESVETAFRIPQNQQYRHWYYDSSKNGWDILHKPRLPHTFCEKAELLDQGPHVKWLDNPKIAEIIITRGGTVDWAATSNSMIQQYPLESLQVALLMLHRPDMSSGALAFLRNVPKLDRPTIENLFDPAATIFAAHRLANGASIEAAVNIGAGTARGHLESDDLGSLPHGELLQTARRMKVGYELLEDRLFETNQRLAQELWDNARLEKENRELKVRLAGKAGAKPAAEAKVKTTSSSPRDPKGYYEVLGLHPAIMKDLTDYDIEKLVKTHYRVLARKYHPDVAEDKVKGEEDFKVIGQAYDVLVDPEKRKQYDRTGN